MPAILPSISIDSDQAESRFLPYIQAWIADDSRMRLAEKSVRIGWTYGDAFKNVRKRLRHANRDYLFATKDQPSAVEYMGHCLKFADIYKQTKSILSHGEDTMKVPVLKDGQDTGFTEEVRFCYIKFDNGSRIIAFSSNPNAMLVYGGDVGLDEFAAHPNQEALWETAQGRITMGYDIGVWSAHKGLDTLFYQFAREAAAGKGGWSYYRVTMADAIDLGYLDLIYRLTGKRWTKEEFLADCRTRARLQEVYDQSYDCNPKGTSGVGIPWSAIQQCTESYKDYRRGHLESEALQAQFGPFDKNTVETRRAKIRTWLRDLFGPQIRPGIHHLGYDVAASGQGDLACWWLDRKESTVARLSALLTARTEDWDFHTTALHWFLSTFPAITGRGDETGLGRQICWTAANTFPHQFEGVNFRGNKHNMGFELTAQFASGERRIPEDEPDVAQDFFALRRSWQGKSWIYTESSNPLNPASHCDIAWAGALAHEARNTTPPVAVPARLSARLHRPGTGRAAAGLTV